MAGEWNELPLSEAVLLNPTTPLKRGTVYPFVEMSAISAGTRDVKCSEHREFNGGGSRFKDRDTLMARITPCLENGKIARFHAPMNEPIAHGSTEFIVVRGKPSVTDNDYAYYLTISPEVRAFAISQMTGTSGRQRVPTDALGGISIPVPPLAEQKAIAAVLGALDDKIELNRQLNATLEAMARALFQSWFVDFDPVRAKLDGRPPAGLDPATAALFPDSFQDSPIGALPKGWSVSPIADISKRIAMGPFGSRITRDNFVPEGVPVVRGGNLTDGFIDDEFVYLTELKADDLRASVAHSLDIVFTHRGTLGQVGIVPEHSRYPRYIVSQSQMVLSVNSQKLSPWMVYLFFRSPIGESALLANTSTTGVPAISRPTTSLKAIPIVVPPVAISRRFDEIMRPLFQRREQNTQQSRTLATLRDTLLPKLLSGELRVEHAINLGENVAHV